MKTYPINLVLTGRRCLVVGGGRIATRKTKRLLGSGAQVVVIAPKISDELNTMAQSESEQLTVEQRGFEPSDLAGAFLVYAATDDRAFNKKIIELAKACNILVCSVDRYWRESSFITPASFAHGNVSVAVSSQGLACRKTKLIKENLSRHINGLERSELFVLGTDHNYLNLEKRSQFHLVGECYEEVGAMLHRLWGIQGFVLLNTCNRVELIAAGECDPVLLKMISKIMGFDKLAANEFYFKKGSAAYRHLCLNVSGLNSQIIGENHISNQFKLAFELSEQRGWSGGMMHEIRNLVQHCARQIRQENAKLFRAIDIEELVLQFAQESGALRQNSNVAVLGTGEVGRNLTDLLNEKGVNIYWGFNKNVPKMFQLGSKVELFPLSDLKQFLPRFDLIIAAATVKEPLIKVRDATLAKDGANLIDIGVPQNISQGILEARSDLDLHNLDDLKHWHRRHNCDLDKLLQKADEIINLKQDEYERFIASIEGGSQSQ